MVTKPQSEMTPTEVVLACCDLIMWKHRPVEACEKYIADDFIEHDPNIEGGDKAGFLKFLLDAGWDQEAPGGRKYNFFYDRIIASGEWVVTHMHVTEGPDDPVLVFMDLYRVRDGKLAEHWHVRNDPPKDPANKAVTPY